MCVRLCFLWDKWLPAPGSLPAGSFPWLSSGPPPQAGWWCRACEAAAEIWELAHLQHWTASLGRREIPLSSGENVHNSACVISTHFSAALSSLVVSAKNHWKLWIYYLIYILFNVLYSEYYFVIALKLLFRVIFCLFNIYLFNIYLFNIFVYLIFMILHSYNID